MTDTDAQRMIDRASLCVRRRESEDALRWLDRATQVLGQTGREQMLRGILLADQGNMKEAEVCLRTSTQLSPADPRVFYNHACLLVRANDLSRAREATEEALRLHPYYGPAMRLRQGLESGKPEAHFDLGEPHMFPVIASMSGPWTAIGWASAVFALIMAIVRVVHPVATLSLSPGAQPLSMANDPASITIVFLSVVSLMAALLWTGIDVLDRRARVIWLVPMIVFSFWQGWTALPMALYLWIGRRMA